MDPATCHVVYVDKRATRERYENHESFALPSIPSSVGHGQEIQEVRENLNVVLRSFDGVHICLSGPSCLAKLLELDESSRLDCKPTLLIIEVFTELDVRTHQRERSTPSPSSPYEPFSNSEPEEESEITADIYSFRLLEHVVSKMSTGELSKLVVPIAMTHNWESQLAANHPTSSGREPRPGTVSFTRDDRSGLRIPMDVRVNGPHSPIDHRRRMRYLEAGALDVLTSPLVDDRVSALVAHVYRAHKDASNDRALLAKRKRSWVGLEDEENAVLREAMVENLMTSICKPETTLHSYHSRTLYSIDPRKEDTITQAVARWDFSAHAFDDNELVHAAFLMLNHVLRLPELKKWRMPADELKNFLVACRAAYNGFVLYHNFRHVVDVLQAVFYFLLQIGTLPPYPTKATIACSRKPKSPIASLLTPFDALTLLISAIGHDVGHPGVNNAFLVALKAPLAQLYNDNSVLEAFHCAAYSQILRRYWNVAFEDTLLRQLLIKSILATDMGVHFKYMTDLGNLQDKLYHNKGTDGWSVAVLEDYKSLTCGLLIKCADISNVARPFNIAAKWTKILQDEFARQGDMERKLGIPTTLFGGPPEIGNITKLANSQIGFMNIFACPLFEAVTDILPGMQFAVDEIKANQQVWKAKIEEAKAKEGATSGVEEFRSEGFQSPRSGSPNRLYGASPEFSHPEGLPASGSDPVLPANIPMSTSQQTLERQSCSTSALLDLGRNSYAETDWPAPAFPNILSQAPEPIASSGSAAFQSRDSESRRSSSALPAADILRPVVSTRRSSNTVPSQIKLGVGLSPVERETVSHENVQPARPASIDTLPNASNSSRPGAVSHTEIGRHGNNSIYTGSAGGNGGRSHRGDKGSDVENGSSASFHSGAPHFSRPLSNRHSTQPSSGRYSAPSNSDRYSNATSGAQTLSSHFNATSPTETQATSFLTDGSDAGTGDDGRSSLPEMVDTERPGSGHHIGIGVGSGVETANDVKTLVPASNGHVGGERVVRKKTSSFLKRFEHWINKKPASP